MRIRIRRIKKQFAVRSSQFGDGPGSGHNRLARRLRIGLSNSCQEAIARSKSQPFKVSIQGQLVMLGFILRLGQDRRHGGRLFKHLRQRGKRRRSKAGLLVLVERRSRLIKLVRLSNRPATTVGKAICSLLKGHMVRVRVRTITADHGQEFAAHGARSRKISAPFLADRYRSWQRGRVENAIGLGRAFIPKRTDLRNYSHRRIRQVENNPDSRPMKLHDWRSRSDGYSSYRSCAK